MTPYDLALLRGWIQGLDWDTLSDLYLDNASIHDTRHKVLQLRNQLLRKARLLNLSCNDFPDSPPIHNEKLQKQGIAWLTRISQLPSPSPKPDHKLDDWLPADIARELKKINIFTLSSAFDHLFNNSELLNRQQQNTLFIFFDHWPDLFPDQQQYQSHQSLNIPTTLDRLNLPETLNGATGANRAPLLKCKLSANNDLQALREWLSLWNCGTPTYNAYRKEVERFLLWMIISQGKPFSSTSTKDCRLYREFLLSPNPSTTWIGDSKPRSHPDWKPFRGPLSNDSIRYAENNSFKCL